MDFIVPDSAFWEDYPCSEKDIKKALDMRASGVENFRIARELEIEIARMLYWMGQYRKGRRWESEQQ